MLSLKDKVFQDHHSLIVEMIENQSFWDQHILPNWALKKQSFQDHHSFLKWKLSLMNPWKAGTPSPWLLSPWRPEQLTCRVFFSVINTQPFQDHLLSTTLLFHRLLSPGRWSVSWETWMNVQKLPLCHWWMAFSKTIF